jgi:DNA-binding response OmpR family regulator
MIEDLDTHSDMIKMTFDTLGYDTIPCATFADVRREVSALQSPPSGILLDLSIPPEPGAGHSLESGRDCGIWLRSCHLTKDVPIIVYSAYTDDVRVPGWCDIIRVAAVLKKHKDSIKLIERTIKDHFH